MGYSGNARWEWIAAVKDAVKIPVIGNGDIRSPRNACAMVTQTGCDAVMIGRTAPSNPWIFRQIQQYCAGIGNAGNGAADALVRRAVSSGAAKSVRDDSRVFFASASDELPDKQGRITVPPALRAYAGLQRDCVVIGANTRLEIWDTQAWDTYLAAQEDSFAEAAEEVLPGIL